MIFTAVVACGDRRRTFLQTSETAVAHKRQWDLIAQHPRTWSAAGILGPEDHVGPDCTPEEPCDERDAGLHVGVAAGLHLQIQQSQRELPLSDWFASHATWPLPEAQYQ